MTTSSSPAATAGHASATEYTAGIARADRVTAVAGLTACILLAVFIQISTTPGVTDHAALQNWLMRGAGSSHAVVALTVGALSYAPFIVFFAGLRTVVRRWDRTGLAAGAVSIGAAMFLAGNIAADIGTLAIPLARHTVPWFTPDTGQAVLLDHLWLVTLTESQGALATAIGAAAVAGWLARRRGDAGAPPRLLVGWGLLALPAMLPILVAPGNLALFIPSNLFRLLWVLAMSGWLLAKSRR